MIFGMSLHTYTVIHVAISLIAIGSGLVVMYGLLAAKRLDSWTALFLSTTVLTSVTGFGFPFHGSDSGDQVGSDIAGGARASPHLARYARASGRRMARDLRFVRGDCTLSQRFRSGGPVV